MNKKVGILFFILVLNLVTIAQSVISGKVIDSETSMLIEGVNVFSNQNLSGTITNHNGEFHLDTNRDTLTLTFSIIGYTVKSVAVNIDNTPYDLGIIKLHKTPYSLSEITIKGGLTSSNNNPVSISEISSKTISQELGTRPLPMVMQSTPGIFGIRNGGGSGDARLSIRGFQQEDLSLLLNGIPVSSEENGLVYWSNWLGLSYAASEIQIQKGTGLSNSSVYSIGGSVNFITKNSEKPQSTIINTGVTSYGNYNASITLNSGLLKNRWNTTTMFSFETGSGYVDATKVKSFAYFFSAHKKLNDKQNITINLIGAPQRHNQRTLKLTNEEVEKYGIKYNKDWGGFEGEQKNASVNFYHNPFISFNHDYNINESNALSTSIYIQGGYGGGQWSESFNYASSIFSYRDNAGQIDWETIYSNNANNTEEYTLANGETVSGYSTNVQTNYFSSHIKAGIISDYEHVINKNLRIITGIHYKFFNSHVREKIDHLLGGEFFIEDYSWSLAGVAGRNQIKTVGDIIRTDNSSVINYASVYSKLIYNTSRINAFFSVKGNNSWYQRIDRFNYIENTKSEIVSLTGFNLRTGASFKISEHSNIFINASYISRTPYFKFIFGNYTNVIVQNLENEKIASTEVGYNITRKTISAKASIYYTERHNVSMLTNEHIQLEDNNMTRAMINGLNAVNMGIEAEVETRINSWFNIGVMASLGDFKWKNNVKATLLNDNNVVVDTVQVMVKDIYIGGTAQQQLGLFGNIKIMNHFNFKGEYLYFNKLYADFDPTTRSDPTDMSQPFQIPDYGILNIYLNIPFKIKDTFAQFQINGYNVLNSKHIVVGEDGENHDLASFKGFWSFGTNISCSLSILL